MVLDMLLNKIKQEKSIDIYNLVRSLRFRRERTVETHVCVTNINLLFSTDNKLDAWLHCSENCWLYIDSDLLLGHVVILVTILLCRNNIC